MLTVTLKLNFLGNFMLIGDKTFKDLPTRCRISNPVPATQPLEHISVFRRNKPSHVSAILEHELSYHANLIFDNLILHQFLIDSLGNVQHEIVDQKTERPKRKARLLETERWFMVLNKG